MRVLPIPPDYYPTLSCDSWKYLVPHVQYRMAPTGNGHENPSCISVHKAASILVVVKRIAIRVTIGGWQQARTLNHSRLPHYSQVPAKQLWHPVDCNTRLLYCKLPV